MFMHVSFWHLLGNMLFLWVFGSFLETVVGRARYLAYYFIGGLSGTLLFTLVEATGFALAQTPSRCHGPSLIGVGRLAFAARAHAPVVRLHPGSTRP